LIDFRKIEIPRVPDYVLKNARVPLCLLETDLERHDVDGDRSALVDIGISGGDITSIGRPGETVGEAVDLGGQHVWPMLVDMHTHLDKGHIVTRSPNPDGTFAGACGAAESDRKLFWRPDDIYRRMSFGLRCAEAHGVTAIRTHLDSHTGQAEISWEVFRRLRREWKDRIDLQAVCLFTIDEYLCEYGVRIADLVASSGGILGGVTDLALSSAARPQTLDLALDALFRLAAERDLDVDLHVDENGDPSSRTLLSVADAVLRNRFENAVTCGHCCSLAVQDEKRVETTLRRVAEAKLSIVVLPTVNMYLQDRRSGRTPRWRGVTVIKEMMAHDIPVAVGGDNCRDAFHAYGDHDMVDTFRQSVRILHLDHPFGVAPALSAAVPGRMMGNGRGVIRTGRAARLVVFNARTMNELMCRPQQDRILVRDGVQVVPELPDYSELDFVADRDVPV
jgi:cytosine/creatinine deaminase